MKTQIIKSILAGLITLSSFSHSTAPSFPDGGILNQVLDDGGWSSSGGGHLITDSHNPWLLEDYFHRDEAKTWCVVHGGKENFSLPKDKAVKRIARALEFITDELKKQWPVEKFIGSVNFGTTPLLVGNAGKIEASQKFPNIKKNELLKLATRFKFQNTCTKETDLKFLLGVIKGDEYEFLVKNFSKIKNRKTVGIAIRTSYRKKIKIEDEFYKVGKGFIWLTPDRGTKSYEGPRNKFDKKRGKHNDIWNREENLNKYYNFIWDKNLSPNFTAIGPFVPVITHEVGHTLGYRHVKDDLILFDEDGFDPTYEYMIESDFLSLMGENFPANAVIQGMVLKRRYLMDLKEFGASDSVNFSDSSWAEKEGLEGTNNHRFRAAYRLPYTGDVFSEDHYIHMFPNRVEFEIEDSDLAEILRPLYGIELEYGFGNFENYGPWNQDSMLDWAEVNHNYPAKLRLIELSSNPIEEYAYCNFEDHSEYDYYCEKEGKEEEFKLNVLSELKLIRPVYSQEQISVIPLVLSNNVNDLFKELFRTTVSFVVELAPEKKFSVRINSQYIEFLNLQSFLTSKIKLRDKLYFLSGEEVDSKNLPDPFHRDFKL